MNFLIKIQANMYVEYFFTLVFAKSLMIGFEPTNVHSNTVALFCSVMTFSAITNYLVTRIEI